MSTSRRTRDRARDHEVHARADAATPVATGLAGSLGVMVNRRERRANTIALPHGRGYIRPINMLVVASDEFGRPTMLRCCYDDEELKKVLDEAGLTEKTVAKNDGGHSGDRAHFVTAWVDTKRFRI